VILFDGLMSGLGLRFSHIVELWFWCLQGPSLSLGGCLKFSSPSSKLKGAKFATNTAEQGVRVCEGVGGAGAVVGEW